LDPIPEDARRFLDSQIDSIDQLEILRVLAEEPGRERPVADLAGAVQARPDAAAAHLAALSARGLIASKAVDGETYYRHGPRPEFAAPLEQLLRLYRERPVTMIKLVYAGANERLRAFADAFKLRKEG
jgi:DNA-binding transcriptional ArsR family regulator